MKFDDGFWVLVLDIDIFLAMLTRHTDIALPVQIRVMH